MSEPSAFAVFSEVGEGSERRNCEEQKRERRKIEVKDERSHEERGDLRRGGRDTWSTLTIYVPTPSANGNYICFNY